MWDDWCTSDVEFRAKANWSRFADDDVAAAVVVEEEEQGKEEDFGVAELGMMPNGRDVGGEEDLFLAAGGGGGGSRRSLSRSWWWAWAWAWTWARLSRSIFPCQSPGGAFII